jgi:hypothetical protein
VRNSSPTGFSHQPPDEGSAFRVLIFVARPGPFVACLRLPASGEWGIIHDVPMSGDRGVAVCEKKYDTTMSPCFFDRSFDFEKLPTLQFARALYKIILVPFCQFHKMTHPA